MKNRRSFLTAVAASGVGVAVLGKSADAQVAPASPTAVSPQPGPTASPKPPSAEALAFALTFRAIDRKRAAGSVLNPKGTLLKNVDEPITRFTVPFTDVK
jgi:hypothetical protein